MSRSKNIEFRGPFRKPDVDHRESAIWYGPDGEDGDSATEVEMSDPSYGGGPISVSEYRSLVGYADDLDEDYPFLKITTTFDMDELRDAIKAYRGNKLGGADIKRWAAGYGTAVIAYYGGDEETVESLP